MAKTVERGMKISSTLKSFLEDRKRSNLSPRTVENYDQDLRYFVDFMAAKGFQFYNDFDRADVREFIDWMRDKTGWSEGSYLKRLRSLKAFFNWVNQDEDCKEQDMRSFASILPKIKKTPQRDWVPAAEDVHVFMKAFNKDTRSGLRDYTMMIVMTDAGLRSGEVSALTPGHVQLDQDRPCIMVPKKGTKTGYRLVWLTEDTARDIRRWINMRDQFAKCDRLFVTHDGNPVDVKHTAQMFARYRKAAGLSNEKGRCITPHTLRHFFATNWIKNGGDLASLRQMTGHSSLETLKIYLHLAGDVSVADVNNRVSARKVVMNATPEGERKGGKKRTPINIKTKKVVA